MRDRLRRLRFVLWLVGTWAVTLSTAEASCTDSTIRLVIPPVAIGSTISASWQIDPACDVIETGLLLGNDVTTLSPAGEPIYA